MCALQRIVNQYSTCLNKYSEFGAFSDTLWTLISLSVKREMLKSFYRLDSRSICFILEDMPLTFPVFHVVPYTVLDTALKGLELVNCGQF